MSNKYKITKEPLADGGWKFYPKQYILGMFREFSDKDSEFVSFDTLDEAVDHLDVAIAQDENLSRKVINYTADGELIVVEKNDVEKVKEGVVKLYDEFNQMQLSAEKIRVVARVLCNRPKPKSPWWKFWQ